MRQEGESSVEEILESIKRVIERDNRAAAPSAPAIKADPQDNSEARAFAMDPASDDEADEILDLGEAGAAFGEDESTDEETAESLTNAGSAEAMRQSLAALAMLSDPPAKPQIVRSGETSLEGMVRDMLRPMLAQWLDDHLPEMVERLVKAEIARIAGKKR
ncbi:DUF2497 domain-containing protein [Aurantiacibacter aquimixticola]|uniref:DUF2497 domain-containing protein n=1 Tax=Aurantiacibacter aquimixticola TaxID=1958945 RepID=A0A419RUT8_9SPHN|nr:DUF2497 domain-containing protein [Aurantiacibacter aquimixticola]RJY09557.1 DUF2497 domain-containing protein [Aurantiacibacter aquimixticola]